MSIPFAMNLFADKNEISKDVLIVGHRGGASLAPENSLACIHKGILAGADMIEVDIHMTRDGYLVVCHDQTLNRTTNGKGRICDMTLEEVRRFHILDSSGSVTKERIPTLEEVLKLVDGKCQLLIEIKRTRNLYVGIEQRLLDLIKDYHAQEWVVIQSFNDSVLECIHQLDPKMRLEKLIVFKFPGIPLIFDGTFSKFSLEKYNYISSFNFYYRAVTGSLIHKLHKHGKEIKIWTLGKPKDKNYLPVDGVITDNPDAWRSLISKH